MSKLLGWILSDCPTKEHADSLDAAYAEGARHEREAILGILDRLIPKFVRVNNSVARQARDEIARRGACTGDKSYN